MINLLSDYIWQSLPQYAPFETNPNLRKKVTDDGKMRSYRGNTAVFLLDDGTKRALQGLRDELYSVAGEMLSEKLQTDIFHMTLHDLVNGFGTEEGFDACMADAEYKAREIISRFQSDEPLRMHTTRMFNMVNTSIVLGLAPADDETHRRLDEMYCALETVVPLGYALTPHITMAYYKPGSYGQEAMERLRPALREVDLWVTLRPKDLVLQIFSDMNHYRTI
ncbi:MAG: hypothetical protein IJ489_04935 [Clostridia bacterium]|nr:hypothetical protein [Clostridia bacterium]